MGKQSTQFAPGGVPQGHGGDQDEHFDHREHEPEEQDSSRTQGTGLSLNLRNGPFQILRNGTVSKRGMKALNIQKPMIPFNKQVPTKALSMVKHTAILDTQTVVLGVCVYHMVVLGWEPGTSLCREVLGHVPRTGLHGIVITEHVGSETNHFCSVS